jgi:hypothetical protein
LKALKASLLMGVSRGPRNDSGTRVGVGAGLFEQFPGRGGVHDERAEDFELWVGQQRAQGFGAARRGEGTTRLRTTGRSGEKLKL